MWQIEDFLGFNLLTTLSYESLSARSQRTGIGMLEVVRKLWMKACFGNEVYL